MVGYSSSSTSDANAIGARLITVTAIEGLEVSFLVQEMGYLPGDVAVRIGAATGAVTAVLGIVVGNLASPSATTRQRAAAGRRAGALHAHVKLRCAAHKLGSVSKGADRSRSRDRARGRDKGEGKGKSRLEQ